MNAKPLTTRQIINRIKKAAEPRLDGHTALKIEWIREYLPGIIRVEWHYVVGSISAGAQQRRWERRTRSMEILREIVAALDLGLVVTEKDHIILIRPQPDAAGMTVLA